MTTLKFIHESYVDFNAGFYYHTYYHTEQKLSNTSHPHCLLSSTIKMSLLQVPVELLLEVFSYLEFVFDLGSLYQCHPLLYTLLKDRVDELLKTEQSLQPLAWAAANGKELCVRKLLDAGAWFNDLSPGKYSLSCGWYT